MKKKKIAIISIILIIILSILTGLYTYLNKKDKNTTLTILEKQWIEKNKNKVIDLSVVNDIPVFNYDGNGVFFDFISSLEKNTELNFNKLSYEYGENPTSNYAFKIVDEVKQNDIKIYEDNYVLITKENIKYNNIDDISSYNVGVLSTDLDKISYYLKSNENLLYKAYDNSTKLLADMNSTSSNINAIILPKTIYLKEIVEKENFNISYNITEMKKYFVLELGNSKRLNKIIEKYYKKWYKEDYNDSYNKNFSDNYFSFKQIYEQEKVNFRSKRYKYAYINYAPYDSSIGDRLVGINYEIIKGFAKIADIEVSYQEYKNYDELVNSFNKNQVDFYMNASNINKYDLDIFETISTYDEKIVILSKIEKKYNINNIASLKDMNVITIKNSKIEQELIDNKIKVTSYNNINDLLKKKKENDVIVIDKNTYDMYLYNSLKDYKINYIFNLNSSYTYISRSIEANKIFNEYFDFYLSYINIKEFENNINYKMFIEKITDNKLSLIIIGIFIILVIISTIILIKKIKPKKKKITISKEDKLKYIDMLTSLKNRNYLNDSMEKWDSSEVYPQAIIVVDLNNVAYINDNYGHEEGDNIIKEAASILIKTQIENTEIMRTNGNEFLIYMVEYDEKQVVSYIRKLNKELKDLKHGFGAAIGYSMIPDELKTIDDAINEATLDMKNNKEEIQN